MDSEELNQLAVDLGLKRAGATSNSVKRAIEREMLSLQASNEPNDKERHRLLVEAHQRVSTHTSRDLVTMPWGTLELLVKALRPDQPVGPEPGSTPEREMRQSSVAAATRATSDFRRGRTLPLVGIGAVVAALWGTRAAFNIDIRVDVLVWGIVCLAIVLSCAGVLVLARRNQDQDERTLRRLYDPDWQEEALFEAVGMPKAYLENARTYRANRRKVDDTHLFSRTAFKEALSFLCGETRRYKEAKGLASADVRLIRGRPLTTVDLESALDDAADLALRRFFELGQVHAQFVNGRQMLALGPAGGGPEV